MKGFVAKLAFKAAALAERAVDSPLGTHAGGAGSPHVYALPVDAHELLSVPHAHYLELVGTVLCKLDGLHHAHPFAKEVGKIGLAKVDVAGIVFGPAYVDDLELLLAAGEAAAGEGDGGEAYIGSAFLVVDALELMYVREFGGGLHAGGEFELPAHRKGFAILRHQGIRRMGVSLDLVALTVGYIGQSPVVVVLDMKIKVEDMFLQSFVIALAYMPERRLGVRSGIVRSLVAETLFRNQTVCISIFSVRLEDEAACRSLVLVAAILSASVLVSPVLRICAGLGAAGNRIGTNIATKLINNHIIR